MVTLIRHATAADASDDTLRPLTSAGRAAVRRLADFLRPTGALKGTEIWHSSLVRARETAQVIAGHIGRKLTLKEVEGLAPEDSPGAFLHRLAGLRKDVIVVGHNPHLTTLAALMIRGDASLPAVGFDKCTAVCLENFGQGSAGDWSIHWCVAPQLLSAEDVGPWI
jgi:phosphohistidine phosphatase